MSRALWLRPLFPVILVPFLSSALYAQPDQATAAQQADREQKGLQLLRDAVAQSQAFAVPINRVIVESTAAELLWTRDEALARSFLAAFSSGCMTSRHSPRATAHRKKCAVGPSTCAAAWQ